MRQQMQGQQSCQDRLTETSQACMCMIISPIAALALTICGISYLWTGETEFLKTHAAIAKLETNLQEYPENVNEAGLIKKNIPIVYRGNNFN
jgi:hypothetical protein